MASPIEILIVALAFGIVGTYVLCCRHFINSSEKDTASPARRVPAGSNDRPAGARPVHA